MHREKPLQENSKKKQSCETKHSKNLKLFSSLSKQQKQWLLKLEVTMLSNGESLVHYNKKQSEEKQEFEDIRNVLLEKFHIYSKYVGVGSASKNIKDFVDPPCLLDICATKHLQTLMSQEQQDNPVLRSLRYRVYEYFLETRKCWLVDGHKFGADFLLYEGNPDIHHATSLVFIQQSQGTLKNEQEIMTISRLSGMCKKKAIAIYEYTSSLEIIQQQIETVKPKERGLTRAKEQKNQ